MKRPLVLVAPCLLLLSCAAPAPGEPPGGTVDVEAAAAHRYRSMVEDLAARGALDRDAALDERLRRIVAALAQAANGGTPGTPRAWEVHCADDPRLDAIAMPGGKLLVGAPFVRRLALTDGELATLVGHEMGHVVAGHRAVSAAGGFESGLAEDLRVAERMRTLELEADAIGIDLALRAGFPTPDVLAFYEKLLATTGEATFSPTHPSARERLEQARARVGPWVR